jgi:hypothetical protein
MFDLVRVQMPSIPPLYKDAMEKMQVISYKCCIICDRSLCGRGQSQLEVDMEGMKFGAETDSTRPEENERGTTISFIQWTRQDRILQFKDSNQKSWRAQGRSVENNWWDTDVLGPIEALRHNGAEVEISPFRLCPWNEPKAFSHWLGSEGLHMVIH